MTIALVLLTGLTAGAQGKWSTGMNVADELKGQEAQPYYLYRVDGEGSFVVWDWDDFLFKVNTFKGVFDVWYYESDAVRVAYVTLGLYSLEGKLIDRLDNLELIADVDGRSAWVNKDGFWYSVRKKIKKMKKALKSGSGYLRLLSPRRGAPELDFNIMPYSNEPKR